MLPKSLRNIKLRFSLFIRIHNQLEKKHHTRPSLEEVKKRKKIIFILN